MLRQPEDLTVTLDARPLRPRERLMAVGRRWRQMMSAAIKAKTDKHGRWWIALAAERPSSMREHFAYVHSLTWLPDDYAGKGWKWAGFIYGYTLGAMFVAAGNGIASLHEPLRGALFTLLTVLPMAVLLVVHPLPPLVFGMCLTQIAGGAVASRAHAATTANRNPASVREHFAYVHSLTWLSDDYAGKGWKWAGFIYGYSLGALVVAAGNGITSLHKPLRGVLFLLLVLPVTVLVVIHH